MQKNSLNNAFKKNNYLCSLKAKQMTYTNPFEQHETETLVDEKFSNKLVIHNDDHNTFDWVADALIDVCNQTLVQAEQCAMIIHTKGKYAVKEGAYNKLKPLREAIVERGINATID